MEGSILQVEGHAAEEELDHGEGGGVGDGAGVGELGREVGVAVAGVVTRGLLHAAPGLVVAVAYVLAVGAPCNIDSITVTMSTALCSPVK